MAAASMQQMFPQYEFEIAFSFCAKDEAVVTGLNDLLKERYSTFLYSKRQEQLAGSDGEESFSEVFAEKARLVVIFLRPEWGNTPFTRIEERAIKNRAFDNGYDFTIWVVTEPGLSIPSYVERTRLYYGLDRFGVKGLAGAVEHRLQSLGIAPKLETIAEKAERLAAEKQAESDRRQFLGSDAGLMAARQEFKRLIDAAEEEAAKLQAATSWVFTMKRPQGNTGWDNWVEVGTEDCWMAIQWSQRYTNSLENSEMEITYWDSVPDRPGRYFISEERPRARARKVYKFERTRSAELGWTLGSEFISATDMPKRCLEELLEHSHRFHMEKRRR